MRLDLPEHLLLDPRILEHRFDHEIAAVRVLGLVGGMDARQERIGVLLARTTALHRLLHEPHRVLLALLGGLERDVLEHDLDARLGGHIGDRRAHHPGAEHDHPLRSEGLDLLGAPPRPVDGLEVEEERLDHVLGHLAYDQVDEVAALDLEGVVDVELRRLHRRGHDVVRGRVVGALYLLSEVGRERRQVHRQRGRRRRAARDLVSITVPGLGRLGVGLDPLLCGRDQVVPAGHDLIHQAELLGLRRAVALALQQRVHQRVHDPQQPDGPDDAARAREQTQLDLGEADHCLGVVDDDPVMRGQADLEAAAERRAVDRGHNRLAERLQPPEALLAHADHLRDLLGVLLARAAQVVQVAAREERALGGRDDHALDLVLLGLEPVERLPERVHERLVHRVGRLVGVVHREDDHSVGVLLPADHVRGRAAGVPGAHRTASTTVAMPMPPPTHSVARP